jgi:hypothetical protein
MGSGGRDHPALHYAKAPDNSGLCQRFPVCIVDITAVQSPIPLRYMFYSAASVLDILYSLDK